MSNFDVILITPTRGRPECFDLLQTWVDRQTFRGKILWIIATDGDDGYRYRWKELPGWTFARRHWIQQVVVRRDHVPGVCSLAANLNLALAEVSTVWPETDDPCPILILEDDDYYAPSYLDSYWLALQGVPLVGAPRARYYHARYRKYRHLQNTRHASLAQTGLRSFEAFQLLGSIVAQFVKSPHFPSIDIHLWDRFRGSKALLESLSPLHVSLKGMPGTRGYGIGHDASRLHPDDDGAIAREWGIPPEVFEVANRDREEVECL